MISCSESFFLTQILTPHVNFSNFLADENFFIFKLYFSSIQESENVPSYIHNIYRLQTTSCVWATNTHVLHMERPKTIVQTKTITVSPLLTKKSQDFFVMLQNKCHHEA